MSNWFINVIHLYLNFLWRNVAISLQHFPHLHYLLRPAFLVKFSPIIFNVSFVSKKNIYICTCIYLYIHIKLEYIHIKLEYIYIKFKVFRIIFYSMERPYQNYCKYIIEWT